MDLLIETKGIIKKLFLKRRIGGKHTEEKNCLRWIKNLPPVKHKEVIREWQECIKEGIVLRSIKTGELHVSLNPRKLKEIHEIIKEE